MKKIFYLVIIILIFSGILLSGCTSGNDSESRKAEECTAKFEFKYQINVYTMFSDDPVIAVSAKNISEKALNYAEVGVSQYDANGEFIEIRYIYYTGRIEPGESVRMDIMTYSEECKSCKFNVLDCY